MKRIFTLLAALFSLSLGKSFSQDCISLQCAASHTGVVTDGTLADFTFPAGSGCLTGGTYKQIFWEFFFSPAGGDFAQTFTPTVPGDNLDIDWAVFDMNATPTSITCPIDVSTWTEIRCSSNFTPGLATGPGTDGGGPATTAIGEYYAVAIAVWNGVSNGGLATYSFDISAPQLGGAAFVPANCPLILLPVKLSSFNAKVNNCVVNLDWTAATESDLANYEIQSSNDGAKYQTIATLNAIGTNGNQKYSYQQANPQQGKLYYRLKMVNIDGKFEYSNTIAMKLDCSKKQVFAYPNPVKDILNVNITNSRDNFTTAKLFDANGKIVYSGIMISGTNTINTSHLAKGVYMLKLISSTDTQNIKVIK